MSVVNSNLPLEIKQLIVNSARNWPKTLNAKELLNELNKLAEEVYKKAKEELK